MEHSHDLRPFAHSHAFADEGQSRRERALAAVTALTLATMLLELVVGWWTGSLALTADGWHMGTHALALGGAVIAYRLSQRASAERAASAGDSARSGFAFGGWKIEVLTAYTSGLVLMGVALWLAWEGVDTLRHLRPVDYRQALVVAVSGLVVNLASVWLLARGKSPATADAAPAPHGHGAGHDDHDDHDHGDHAQGHDHLHDHDHHDHDHDHDHAHRPVRAQGHGSGHGPGPARGLERVRAASPQPVQRAAAAVAHGHGGIGHGGHAHDHNFSAAYIHVIADAFTSVLAIVALAGGAWFGLGWLDPAVALVGAVVIGQWAWSVLGATARALVDATEDPALARRVRELIEADGDAKLADLHVWQVGGQAWCAALSVVADAPQPAAAYRARLAQLAQIRHVTVEVHRCEG